MKTQGVDVNVTINNVLKTLTVAQDESLLLALRRASYFSVKSGCDDGTCGICIVLINGKPERSCKIKALTVEGAKITTIEGLGDAERLHPLQEAFMETGAIQCGFCTPAQILRAKALLETNSNPTEDEIRNSLNSVLCRCTGYVRGVDAIQRAAAKMRDEPVEPFTHLEQTLPENGKQFKLPESFYRRDGGSNPLPPLVFTPREMTATRIVGKPEIKVDAKKLVQGRPVFTDDFRRDGMLYGALFTSPHAHARIRRIDTSRARALPGVRAIFMYEDIPRIKYASGGQSYPQPLPYDQVSLDNKVRHVGDRVAVAAAETPGLAQEALNLIECGV